MLKKLIAAIRKPLSTGGNNVVVGANAPQGIARGSRNVAVGPADHPHDFSCTCKPCLAETVRRTAERLRKLP